MLDSTIRSQLKAYLERLQQPIELIATAGEDETSLAMLALLREIATLSALVSVRDDGSDARRPSFAIGRPGEPARVHFAGIPMGHEFTSLVLALLQVGGYPPKVEAALIEQIRAIRGPLRFETYMSLSCHNCPDVVQAFNLMAVINPAIESVTIDGALFQSEVNDRNIMAVPSVFANDKAFGQGRMSLEEIVARLVNGSGVAEAERLSAKHPFDVLIVGGGPAGAAAAVYAARKGIRTGVLAERFGGQVLDTVSIENLISVPHTDGAKLATALEQHVKTYDVDIMNNQRVVALESVGADGLVRVRTASGAQLAARSVILATGARWREMNVPGEAQYKTKGVCFCPHCDGPLFRGKRVAVIGGGNSGVEAAIDLAGIVSEVTLLEFDTQLRADEVLQAKLRTLANVRTITRAQTTEVLGDGEKVTGLTYRNRVSGEVQRIDLEGIFVQIGLLPNTDWLNGTVALSKRGEIDIDSRGQTSLPGVFAAGDATTVPFKQIIISMGQGASAALGAFDYLIRAAAPAQVSLARAA